MKEYNIGIYTFWDVPNYGTYIQAYALQRIIEKLSEGKDVRQIAHLNRKHFRAYYSLIQSRNFLRPYFYKTFFSRLLNYKEIKQKRKLFQSNYRQIKHTKEFSDKELGNVSFDKVVLGSDIIWDYKQGVFGNDLYLFGEGFKALKTISYAASFGSVKPDEKIPEKIIHAITQMDKISVRDSNSANIINRITGEYPEIVLDPTWLWEFENDSNIVKPKHENYIVVYGQDFTDLFVEQLISYAQRNDLKLICLDCNSDSYSWCDLLVRQSELTPFEWVGYFLHAAAVATSTYHGLTFGLIFNKPLAFCSSEFILAKSEAFLRKMDLLELYTNENCNVAEMFERTKKYDLINSIIDIDRDKSIKYLMKNVIC